MKQKSDKVQTPIAKAPVEPPRQQPSDEHLREQILARISSDGQLAGEAVEIGVENGCATLTGVISKEYLRQLIVAHVCAVPGVLVVKDQLRVSEEGPMAGPQD